MERWRVDAQLLPHAIQPLANTDVVDARGVDLVRADDPAPEHRRIDRHIPEIGLDDGKPSPERAHRGVPLAGLRNGRPALHGNQPTRRKAAFDVGEELIRNQRGGRADGVGRVDQYDVEPLLGFRQKLGAVADEQLGTRILVRAARNLRQILQRCLDDGVVDLDFKCAIDIVVQQDVAQRTTISAADDEHPMRIRVRKHRDVHERFVIGELFVEARLHRAFEDERSPWALQVENLEGLPGCLLGVKAFEDPKPLLDASIRRFGEPVVAGAGHYAEYAWARCDRVPFAR